MSILRTAFFAITLAAFTLGATACGGSDGDTETMPEDPAMGDDMGDDGMDDDFGDNPCGDADDFEDDFEDDFDNPCGGDVEDEDW